MIDNDILDQGCTPWLTLATTTSLERVGGTRLATSEVLEIAGPGEEQVVGTNDALGDDSVLRDASFLLLSAHNSHNAGITPTEDPEEAVVRNAVDLAYPEILFVSIVALEVVDSASVVNKHMIHVLISRLRLELKRGAARMAVLGSEQGIHVDLLADAATLLSERSPVDAVEGLRSLGGDLAKRMFGSPGWQVIEGVEVGRAAAFSQQIFHRPVQDLHLFLDKLAIAGGLLIPSIALGHCANKPGQSKPKFCNFDMTKPFVEGPNVNANQCEKLLPFVASPFLGVKWPILPLEVAGEIDGTVNFARLISQVFGLAFGQELFGQLLPVVFDKAAHEVHWIHCDALDNRESGYVEEWASCLLSANNQACASSGVGQVLETGVISERGTHCRCWPDHTRSTFTRLPRGQANQTAEFAIVTGESSQPQALWHVADDKFDVHVWVAVHVGDYALK